MSSFLVILNIRLNIFNHMCDPEEFHVFGVRLACRKLVRRAIWAVLTSCHGTSLEGRVVFRVRVMARGGNCGGSLLSGPEFFIDSIFLSLRAQSRVVSLMICSNIFLMTLNLISCLISYFISYCLCC